MLYDPPPRVMEIKTKVNNLLIHIPKMFIDPHSTLNKYCSIFTGEVFSRDFKKEKTTLPPEKPPTSS